MTREEAEKLVKSQNLIRLSLNKEFMEFIRTKTGFLDEFYPGKIPLRVRLLALDYDRDTFPRCYCGKPVGFKKDDHSTLLKFCSNSCSSNRQYLSDDVQKLLSDPEYLKTLRIDRKMSYEAIGDFLGVSHAVIRKWCKKHKLPNVKYNESAATTKQKLMDPTWLREEHQDKHLSLEEIASEIGSSKSTVSVYCKKHGIKTNAPNSYDRPAKSSKECLELVNFINSIGVSTETNNRTILNGLELDILIPDKNIAVEYNGLYSHVHRPHEESFSRIKDKRYHLSKTEGCSAAGIQLIHIFSDEWIFKQDIVKSILKSKLGKISNKLYARKMDIREVSANEKSSFMRMNHIQGNSPSSINVGLYDSGCLVACMSFGKSKRNKKYDWELMRYSSILNHTVIGGFSRLLKWFRSRYPGTIISYADRRLSQGQVYSKNGFKFSHFSTPNYFYVDSNFQTRLHRANFMKKRIAPGDDRAEWQIMAELGYRRIWDCGTSVWVML